MSGRRGLRLVLALGCLWAGATSLSQAPVRATAFFAMALALAAAALLLPQPVGTPVRRSVGIFVGVVICAALAALFVDWAVRVAGWLG